MVKVKVLGQVVTQYGTHRTGDILNVSAEFARHLVVDAQAAEYVKAPAEQAIEVLEPVEVEVAPEAAVAEPRKGKK